MLDKIPPEILDRIILLCDPIDIASLSAVNQSIYQHIRHNNNLWQSIFLSHFDDPYEAQPVIRSAFGSHPTTFKLNDQQNHIDWRRTLTARIVLRGVLSANDNVSSGFQVNQDSSVDVVRSLYQLILLIIYTARSPLQSSCAAYSHPSYFRNLRFLHLLNKGKTQMELLHLRGVYSVDTRAYRIYASLVDLETLDYWGPAKLHTLIGLTPWDLHNPYTWGMVRERSYALSNYSSDNLYGPFIPFQSTRVNWCHLRDLSMVVAFNLQELHRNHLDSVLAAPSPLNSGSSASNPFSSPPDPISLLDNTPGDPLESIQPSLDVPRNGTIGLHDPSQNPIREKTDEILWPILNSLESAIPFTQITHPRYSLPTLTWPPSSNLDENLDLHQYDWAGVTGKWLRVVCFLDYRDFHAYNFGGESGSRLNNLVEAVRAMTLDLEIVSINHPPDESHPIPINLRTDCQSHPPIFFKGTLTYDVGTSSAAPIVGQSVLTLRGCVSMTIDDEVRWSMVSTLGGVDKWASEGIQVGGIQSKWGVVGAWTDVNREEVEGPVGPFYFFKTSC